MLNLRIFVASHVNPNKYSKKKNFVFAVFVVEK